jgi:hypothetical protein
MSHTVSVKTKFIDPAAIAATCAEMGIPAPTARGNVRLYAETVSNAIAVKLPGWQYPLAIQADGTTKLDNYGGAWGSQSQLDRFSHLYDTHATMIAARKLGYQVSRKNLPNGKSKVFAVKY